MTKTDKPTRRETLSLFRNKKAFRNIIIELHSTFMVLRLKGCRWTTTVTYDQAFRLGCQNAAEENRRAKLEARKAKKGSK